MSVAERAIRALGAQLRFGGLTPRALAGWAGTDRLSALPALLPRLAAFELMPASTLLAMFVAGIDVAIDRFTIDLDVLHRLEMIDIVGASARARIAILPLGQSVLVCDRLDAATDPDLVCSPDDSSYHLALALPPGRKTRWLDLGSGSAFGPLLRPELATSIIATDITGRAIRFAKLGAELSGVPLETIVSDLGTSLPAALRGACSLVSCNAPIPEQVDDPYRPRWRATNSAFVRELFEHAAAFIAVDGVVVVHAALDALAPILVELPGERVLVAYTPAQIAREFAVGWWVPGAADRHVTARRLLTEWRPHLTHEDRIAALAGTLPPL